MSTITESSFYTLIAIILAAITFTIYFRTWIRATKLALQLSGPPALPLIGNAHLIADPDAAINYANTAFKAYGPIFRIWLSLVPCFVVVEPKYIQLVLGDKKQSDKNFLYAFMHNFIGEGLITNSGDNWKIHRKLIQPCFHIKVLESYLSPFARSAEVLNEKFTTNRDINVAPLINECILHVLHQVIFGLSSDESTKYLRVHPFRKGESPLLTYRITHPWLLVNTAFHLTNYAKTELKQKSKLQNYVKYFLEKKLQNSTKDVPTDFTSLLDFFIEISKENPKEFTIKDVINETCTFILAGQESVAAAVAFTLYNLAEHAEHQEIVFKELEEIFGDNDRHPNLDDLNRMIYLEQCIKESMRMYPSIPMVARKLAEDIAVGKHVLPSGSTVIISPFITHRQPHIYPEPLTFEPSRFNQEISKNRHPFAYLPFSAGTRNCIGHKFAMMEMKVVISSVLRKYRLEAVEGRKLKLSYRITLRARGGIWVKFGERRKC